MGSIAGKWGYTRDGEMYTGAFDTASDAAAAGGRPGDSVEVGQYRDPVPFWDAVNVGAWHVIESAYDHDDWCGDWAADQIRPSREQREELERELRETIRKWCERHKLMPSFGVVQVASIHTLRVPQ